VAAAREHAVDNLDACCWVMVLQNGSDSKNSQQNSGSRLGLQGWKNLYIFCKKRCNMGGVLERRAILMSARLGTVSKERRQRRN
jgi:hypothetical protein